MKNIVSLILLGFALQSITYAQSAGNITSYNDLNIAANDEVAMNSALDKNTTASFPGGAMALNQYLAENFKYTETDSENGFEGSIIIRCIIDVTGKPTECEVIKSVHPIVDKRALRVVSKMPAWEPAYADGIPVASTIYIPFELKIR